MTELISDPGAPIAVAVSGGVDSLYALASLRDQGRDVMPLHARMLPPDLAPAGYEAMLDRLGDACARIGAPLHVADCVDAFAKAVISPFVQSYAQGLTPNPCARCNAAVKFGLLLDIARDLGAARLATGHYIRLERLPDGMALYAAGDSAKDQSYFLSLVPRERLALAVSPLANKTKAEIRAYFAVRGITPPAPDESQEICFVPNDDYRAFLLDRAAKLGISLPGPGTVALPDGTAIGSHKGLWQYTEGQRRGLGIAWSEPLYVLAKEADANRLVAGNAAQLAQHPSGREIRARDCNFLVPFADWPESVLVRTRFRQQPRPSSASLSDGVLVLHDNNPGGPPAKGQIATAYALEDGRLRVLGGGVII